MSYLLEIQEAKSFLYAQLELYKIEFANTGNNKYLEVMNQLNKTANTLNKMDNAVIRLSKENRELKK